MNVELPKDAVVPETSTGGAASSSMAQFVDTPVGMEISESDLKRSEFEEVPESRNVRRINGLAVCSMDIVGAAQADYDNPRLSGEEFERKADEELDAVHTYEGEPMKSFEVPISEKRHRWSEVWSRVGSREGAAARQKGDRQHCKTRGGRVGKDERVQARWCTREGRLRR